MNFRHSYLILIMMVFSSFAYSNIIAIQTDEAPKAIGPYSQAVQAGDYLFVSGQLGIDPATGQFVGDTIEDQTAQVLSNIEAILSAQGLSLQNIVKTEVYLKDINDFRNMNAIYANRFSHTVKPARQAMQVAKLPLDALVEISCIAFIPHTSH